MGLLLALVCCSAETACSSTGAREPPPAAPSDGLPTTAGVAESEARWIARPDAPFVRWVGSSKNASWLLTAGTQRLELTASGELRAAKQWLAHPEYVVTELAPRLGGGFLFTRHGDETLIERATTYLGDLQHVARLGLRVTDVIQGLDRLYALLDRSRSIVALDPTGKGAVDLGPLPEAPAYGPLAFADAWFGVATVPYQGALATYDAGASWHQLGLAHIRGARVADGGILVISADGASLLRPDGTTSLNTAAPVSEPTPGDEASAQGGSQNGGEQRDGRDQGDEGERGVVTRSVLARQLGERLVGAALRGWPLAQREALLLQDGALSRIDLGTARTVSVRERVAPVNAVCHAAALASGIGFVCHTARESLLYEAQTNPLDARLVHRFQTPRIVAAGGTGSLAVSGPCRGPARPRELGSWCIVPKAGQAWALSMKRFDATAQVVPLAGGSAAVITPPSPQRRGSLSIVTPEGGVRSRKALSAAPSSRKGSADKLGRAVWLRGMTERPDGSLSGWVAVDETVFGVLVHQDGTVEVGEPRGTGAGTLFTAQNALALGSEGAAWQTRDGGQSWHAVPVPQFDEATDVGSAFALAPRGCGLVGCVVAGWVRIGWKVSKPGNDLPVPQDSPPTTLPLAGGGRWLLDCGNARRFPRQAPNPSRASQWPSFFGVTPPRRLGGEGGYSRDAQSPPISVRGYAWGPAGVPWRNNGRWVVRALTAYDSAEDSWSTSTTVCPWSDETTSAEAFGGERRQGPPAVWRLHFDPDGRGGLLRIGSVAEAETYLVEPDRPLLRIRGEATASAFGLLGAVRSRGSWFALSAVGSGVVSLSHIESGVAREVMRLRDDSGASTPTLVRNRAETALGLWVQDAKTRGAATRWFIYPIDAARREVGDVLVVDDDLLGATPHACSDDDTGWVLEGPLPLGPSLDLGEAAGRSTRPNSVRARVVVSRSGLCVEGLVGVTSDRFTSVPRSTSDAERPRQFLRGIPLMLRDQDGEGDRWVFECMR